MAEINSFPIESVKVSELAPLAVVAESNIPHEVGGVLYRDTISNLATYITNIIGTTDAIGFLPISVNDGDTLPSLPDHAGFFLAGAGTFINVGGAPNIVTTEKLNAIMTDPTLNFWVLSVEIPIDTQTEYIGISQLIRPDVVNLAPSEKAVYDALAVGGSQDLQSVINNGGTIVDGDTTRTVSAVSDTIEETDGDLLKKSTFNSTSQSVETTDSVTGDSNAAFMESIDLDRATIGVVSSVGATPSGFAFLISKYLTYGGAAQIGSAAGNYSGIIVTEEPTQDNLHTLPNQSGTIAHIENQIEVALPATVLPEWNGKTVIFTSTGLLTIPDTLPNKFNYNGLCLTGVTQTWAITSPKTFLFGTPTDVTEKQHYNFQQRGSTDSIIVLQ